MTIISCGLWISALLLIVCTVDRIFVKGMKSGLYRYFVGPAVLVHDVSQVVVCLLTGAKVRNVQLANPKGGRVEHDRPKILGIGDLLISIAPLVACGAVLLFVPKMFSMPLNAAPALPKLLDITPDSLVNIIHGLIDSCSGTAYYLTTAQYSPTFIAFIYVGLIFTIGVTPDKGKLRYAVACVLMVTLITYFADGAMNNAAENFAANVLWGPLSFAVSMAVLLLGVALVLSAIHSAFKSKKKPYPFPKGATSPA